MSEVQREPTGAPTTEPGEIQAGPGGQPWAGSGPSGPRAGFWRRFAALVVDSIIVGIVEGIIFGIFNDSIGVAYGLATVLSWTYYTLLEGGPRGQTLGKMALSIRVIDFNAGGPIGYGRGFIRQLVKIVSSAVILLGYLWMLWDREKQTWHDKAASSVVVPVSAYPVA